MSISPIATFLLGLSRLSSGVSSGLIYSSNKIESKKPLALDILFTVVLVTIGVYIIFSKSPTSYSRKTSIILSIVGLLLVFVFGLLRIFGEKPDTKNSLTNKIIFAIEIIIILIKIGFMSLPILGSFGISRIKGYEKEFTKFNLIVLVILGIINFIIKLIRYFNSSY